MRMMTILFAALLLSGTAGLAQDRTSELRLSPQEQQAVYRTLSKQRVKAGSGRFDVRVGSRVPRSVSLYGIPGGAPTVSVRGYRYTLVGDRVVLVEPRTRTVVLILGMGF